MPWARWKAQVIAVLAIFNQASGENAEAAPGQLGWHDATLPTLCL